MVLRILVSLYLYIYIYGNICANYITCVYKWLFNQYTTFKLSIHPINIPGGTYTKWVVIDPVLLYMGCAHGHSEKTELCRYGGRLLEWTLAYESTTKGLQTRVRLVVKS
jgi:hypothetical protein